MKSKTNRLEVGVDVHPRKKFSFSSERLSETVSLSERSATVSLVDDGGNSVASTRALAGSLLAYKVHAVMETEITNFLPEMTFHEKFIFL